MIRLLIADDSALVRKLLEGVFLEEGDFEIRTARTGLEALDMVRAFDPHVVTLDVQMPGMDGLTCLGRIMLEAPRPVVMISSLTEQNADATLSAMALGAVDVIAKPGGTFSLELDRLRPLLVATIRSAAQAKIRPTHRLADRIRHQFRDAASSPRAKAARRGAARQRAKAEPAPGLVLIGTSTGGPAALNILLPQLPADFPWPVLIAQHLPATFTGAFAKRLDRECALNVVEVDVPRQLEPGTVYIGRGDADVIVAPRPSGLIALSVPARRDYPWHPSVERMVDSALEHYDGKRLLGVLMTGMGDDGATAMTRLQALGGRTIAEAESTAVVWGMPGELVRQGGATLVLPVEEIAAAVIEWGNADAAD
ncbi:chemotaxis-specific protein-glutamate methyltransferase CheB [Rhodopseudomonas palustris]|uniref:Protein-glutamate methylesterase/protein-glutamine glutaminase 2 n=1 Tax=Rhodopseudomonas palustris (strain BisB18) TaxID=316056 RepID=CHEB2_RHOPB|nr:RecName: Full=Protein-glutamate methylesterase/protein-glutamine glutaminase 2 [Rhodopseudomonas palustris BisB18]